VDVTAANRRELLLTAAKATSDTATAALREENAALKEK
jgi:hypothetical protein